METRENYGYFLDIPTRWIDNDLYQHVNNVHFYTFFDTVIGHYLTQVGKMDYQNDSVVAFAIENWCQYKRPLRFPDIIQAGLRVVKIGNSSVKYEIGLFTKGVEEPAALGYFIHVFVDRHDENRPTPIPAKIRHALEKIALAGS